MFFWLGKGVPQRDRASLRAREWAREKCCVTIPESREAEEKGQDIRDLCMAEVGPRTCLVRGSLTYFSAMDPLGSLRIMALNA